MNKKRKIFQIRERIEDIVKKYHIEENPEILKDAMTIYIRELIPEIQNRDILQYPTREIDFNEKTEQYTLFQRNWQKNQFEYTFGEYPRVIHYKVK
jgi:hypothetical protein